MATATYWKETDSTDLRHQEAIHEGVGTIVRKMFFREQSQLPIRFDIWELPPGVSEGDHTHGGTGEGRALEEIYYFLSGNGMMRIAGEEVAVGQGTRSWCRRASTTACTTRVPSRCGWCCSGASRRPSASRLLKYVTST